MLTAILTGGIPRDVGNSVVGTPALPATTRLAIHATGYLERLRAHLRARYPLLRALAGETVFDLFALGYIRSHPPRSASLVDYGADFPEYLAATQPPGRAPLEALPAALALFDVIQGGFLAHHPDPPHPG